MRLITKPLATFLGMLTALASTASTAGAAVIYFPGQDVPIPTTFAGVSVNLETGAVTNSLAGTTGADMNIFYGGEGISNDADQNVATPSWQPVRTGTNSTDPVVNLAIGTTVDATSPTATDFGGSGGSFTHFPGFFTGTQGYIGFSVELNDPGSGTAYGWALVTLNDDNTPGTIHSWAFEDTGAPLAVGAIPEPSHSLLAVLGLAILALRRRR